MTYDNDVIKPLGPDMERVLVANHQKFLMFLKSRVADAQTAEDVLQSAFARSLERGTPAMDTEGVVTWFYTVLRNALTDHYRRKDVESRIRTEQVHSSPQSLDPELKAAVCACMHGLLPTLKPEYSEVLRAVDLDERPIAEVAEETGITTNNATVRLHRARQALKKQLQKSCGSCSEHGCLDCSCGGPKAKLTFEPAP
jgi:RNA polymerase sigma factor (sigma-70 family)